MKGYLVKFFGKADNTAFCDSLEEAVSIRNMVYGGGVIYEAHTEKSGYNTFVIEDYALRKPDGTLL